MNSDEASRGAITPKSMSSTASAAASSNVGRQLGAVARRVRESQGLTLTDVANSAGISAGMLSRLETGHVTPSLETLVALAGALGVRPALLLQQLGGDEEGAAERCRRARDWKWSGAARVAAIPIICWRPSEGPENHSNPFS